MIMAGAVVLANLFSLCQPIHAEALVHGGYDVLYIWQIGPHLLNGESTAWHWLLATGVQLAAVGVYLVYFSGLVAIRSVRLPGWLLAAGLVLRGLLDYGLITRYAPPFPPGSTATIWAACGGLASLASLCFQTLFIVVTYGALTIPEVPAAAIKRPALDPRREVESAADDDYEIQQ